MTIAHRKVHRPVARYIHTLATKYLGIAAPPSAAQTNTLCGSWSVLIPPIQNPSCLPLCFIYKNATSQSNYLHSSAANQCYQIYLSFLSPFLTLPIALYTLLITPILILLSPLSLLITSYPSLQTQLRTFLSPPINAQLDFILSSSTLLVSPDDDEPANPVMLFLVNILSPIYAIGIGLSAWVAALFWFYAAILGDPEGGCRDSRDDGRAAVLGVMRWWEGWLEQAR